MPPRSVGVFRLLLVDRQVEPVGRCALGLARVVAVVVVVVLVTIFSPSRLAGPRALPSFSLGFLDGARGGLQSARVARLVTGRHGACRGAGAAGGGGTKATREGATEVNVLLWSPHGR